MQLGVRNPLTSRHHQNECPGQAGWWEQCRVRHVASRQQNRRRGPYVQCNPLKLACQNTMQSQECG